MECLLSKLQVIWNLGVWPPCGGWSHTGDRGLSWVPSNSWGQDRTSKHLSSWTEAAICGLYIILKLWPAPFSEDQILTALLSSAIEHTSVGKRAKMQIG